MAKYEISDDVKNAIYGMCDITLKSQGMSSLQIINEISAILSNPISEKNK